MKTHDSTPTPTIRDGQTWGPWRLNAQNLTLQHPLYEIDLESCTTSAEVLDWLVQVQQKSWCAVVDAGHLLAAFIDLLDPQANLCSDGQEKQFNPTAHLKKILAEKSARKTSQPV